MPHHIELNPVSHLTIETVGEPGQRIFYLQGRRENDLITLLLEKVQAVVLADSLEGLLGEIGRRHPEALAAIDRLARYDMRLHEPILPLFRVGNLGLGFNEQGGQVVLVAYELVEDQEEANLVSFWASPTRINALITHIREVVRSGRPICGNCGQPIDPDGHFCPHRNGGYKR
jgi:uncharacterized repeat protein (TIGR03847 family)